MTFEGDMASGPVAIKSKIAAKNNGKKKDKLAVSADNIGAVGAEVTLYRVTGSGDKVIGTKSLNGKSKVMFKVKDRNGKKKTKYYAVVSATDLTKRSVTKVKKVR